MSRLKILSVTILLLMGFGCREAVALPLSNGFAAAAIKGETAVISQYIHLDFVRNRDAPNFYLGNFVGNSNIVALGGVYSITDNFALFAFIPWIQNELRFNNPPPFTGRGQVKTSGWGDLAVSLACRIFNFSGKGWFASSFIQPGIQSPTGSWNQKYRGMRVDREFQPGTGNWSGFVSWITSILGVNNEATVQLQYQGFFRGHGFRHGQLFIYNAAIGHRILPWFLKEDYSGRWWATFNLEFLGQYKSRPSGGYNTINTWSNWGRIAPTISFEVANIFNAFDLLIAGSFQQTVYYKTGDQFPVRPERAYLVQIAAHW
ncbi:MAG: hypothetical protein KDK64_07250 [Chlamydiia bacterium]|nr:hypothetical protein [Chlamydiia bacterium]